MYSHSVQQLLQFVSEPYDRNVPKTNPIGEQSMKNWQVALTGIPLGLIFAVGIPKRKCAIAVLPAQTTAVISLILILDWLTSPSIKEFISDTICF